MKCFSHRVNALAGRLNRHKDYIWWKSLKSVCLVVFLWCDWTCGLKRDGSGWWESLYKYTSPGWILYHPVCGCQPRELLVANIFLWGRDPSAMEYAAKYYVSSSKVWVAHDGSFIFFLITTLLHFLPATPQEDNTIFPVLWYHIRNGKWPRR